MSVEITFRKKYPNGINLTKIYDSKFKSFGIVIKLIVPNDKTKVPLYTLALDILATSSRKYPEMEQLSKELSNLYSASIGSGASKISEYFSLSLTLNCICDEYTIDNEQVSEKATELFLDCLLDPNLENGVFANKYFRLCRDDLIDDTDAIINNKRRYAGILANKRIYKGENYSLSAFDYRDVLKNASPEQVTEAYYELLKKAYIDIFVTGGNNDDKITDIIISRLSELERAPFGEPEYDSFSPLKTEVCRDSETIEANQSQLIMAYKTDNYNEYASKLFNSMLGALPTSKLFMNVREKMSLCYYCDAMLSEFKGTLIINSGLDSNNISLAQEAITEQLEAIQNGDFTDEEMDNAKLYLSEAYLSNYDSKYDICTWYSFQFSHGTFDTPEEKGRKIKAVTRKMLIEEAKHYKLDTVFVLKGENGGNDDEA